MQHWISTESKLILNPIMATTIVSEQLFDDAPGGAQQLQTPSKEVEPKANGLVRASGVIPIEYNERLKAMARKQGKTADQLIGELLMELRPVLDQWEAKQEAMRLRERFGDQWMDLLQRVS